MKILHKVETTESTECQFDLMFWCPGCNCGHGVQTVERKGPLWKFNGRFDLPTFTPSVRVQGTVPLTDAEMAAYKVTGKLPEPKPSICHFYVIEGRIQYLGDCTHALRGQTVRMMEF